jgi:hypothetical protein
MVEKKVLEIRRPRRVRVGCQKTGSESGLISNTFYSVSRYLLAAVYAAFGASLRLRISFS